MLDQFLDGPPNIFGKKAEQVIAEKEAKVYATTDFDDKKSKMLAGLSSNKPKMSKDDIMNDKYFDEQGLKVNAL